MSQARVKIATSIWILDQLGDEDSENLPSVEQFCTVTIYNTNHIFTVQSYSLIWKMIPLGNISVGKVILLIHFILFHNIYFVYV
jgi:hypothetical protein